LPVPSFALPTKVKRIMGYRQLTQAQRYQISAFLRVGWSQRKIAREINGHSSTISRELHRNRSLTAYEPMEASRLSRRRRKAARKSHKRAPSLIDWVAKQIQSEWSPGQIAGFMRRVGSVQVSQQWIYNLIYRDKIAGGDLWRYCRLPYQRRYQRHLAKRAGLGKISDRVGIECRPKAVDDRLHIGHWEGDTILHGHKNSGAVTLVERRSGYLLADCVPKLKANLVTEVIIRELRPIRGAVQTLTLDNGSEFSDHQTFSKALSLTSYFCDPYRSSQRGSNENTNGLLRQYFPKGTDFAKVSRKAIRQAVNRLNNRPRKRLGYRTPADVFWGEYSGGLDTQIRAVLHLILESRILGCIDDVFGTGGLRLRCS